MKKFLALFLVLVMAFSCVLVSCNKDNDGTVDDGEDDEGFGAQIGGSSSSSETSSGTGSTVDTGKTHTDYEWTDVNETVYVTVQNLSVRTDTWVDESTYYKTIHLGESYKRIKSNPYWSLIEFDGGEYYVSSEFLDKDGKPYNYTDTDKTMYVKDNLNIRSYPVVVKDTSETKNNVVLILKKGAEVKVTGISEDGLWARVRHAEYNEGKTDLFCKLSYLLDTAPSSDSTSSTTEVTNHG